MNGHDLSVRRLVTSALAVLIATLLTVAPILHQPVHAETIQLPYRLEPAMTSSIGVQQRGLVADGSLIVWEDSRSGIPDIYAYDLDDTREFRVASTVDYRTQPAVSGSLILWVTGSDPQQRIIEGIDLSTRVTIRVTEEPAEVSDPAVADTLVVWRERRGDRWEIVAKSLSTGEQITISEGGINHAKPSISGLSVVWQSYVEGSWSLFHYDHMTGKTEQLTQTADNDTDPIISGSRVLFRRAPANGGPPALMLLDLKTGRETTIVDDHMVMRGTMKDDVVAWEDWRSGLPDIYAYDIAHEHIFAIARSQQAYAPAVSARGVAWISGSDPSRTRIQAVSMIERLPTDPRDPPTVPSPDSVYVPETRHFMSTGFKSYWQAHGGPDLFGYPLSEEFSEIDPETGEEIVVQYFERVKMEYRPSAPEEARISLARLGAELTADRGFEPLPPAEDEVSEQRIYFPETGHWLAYGFKEFWEANGGLAVFGFPISEEFTENGRTVQYFERARFEFNPDADDGAGKVMLGLLGREALQRMGWLPRPPVDTTGLLE